MLPVKKIRKTKRSNISRGIMVERGIDSPPFLCPYIFDRVDILIMVLKGVGAIRKLILSHE